MIGIYDCVGFITTLAGFLPIFAKEGILYFIKITASFEINNKIRRVGKRYSLRKMKKNKDQNSIFG